MMFAVWPTKRGWLTIAIAVATFSIAMVNLSVAASLLSALLVALLPVSLAMACFSLRGVTVQREAGQDGMLGQPLAMPVTVTNHGRRRHQAMVIGETCGFVEGGQTYVAVAPLGPHETRALPRPVLPIQRGEFDLDELRLRGGDPAGLFYRQKRFHFPRHVVIYPARVDLQDVPLQRRNRVVASAIGQPIGVSGLGQEFFGVRPYRPTDGIRFIHWKATARQRRLMVREFEENTINQVSLFLDNSQAGIGGEGADSNFEHLVAAAASLADYLANVYCRLLFATGGATAAHWRLGTGPELSLDVQRDLASLEPVEPPFLATFETTIERVPPNSIVYILSMHPPQTMPGVIDQLLRLGTEVRFFHADGAAYAGKARAVEPEAVSTGAAVEALHLTPATDLARVFAHG